MYNIKLNGLYTHDYLVSAFEIPSLNNWLSMSMVSLFCFSSLHSNFIGTTRDLWTGWICSLGGRSFFSSASEIKCVTKNSISYVCRCTLMQDDAVTFTREKVVDWEWCVTVLWLIIWPAELKSRESSGWLRPDEQLHWAYLNDLKQVPWCTINCVMLLHVCFGKYTFTFMSDHWFKLKLSQIHSQYPSLTTPR